MTRRPTHTLAALGALTLTLLLVPARAAQSDPLLVTGGQIVLSSDSVSSFFLTGSNFNVGGDFGGSPTLNVSAGSVLHFATHQGGNAVFASNARIDGIDYHPITTVAAFTFSYPEEFVVPSAPVGTHEFFTMPFTMTGSIQGFDYNTRGQGKPPLFTIDVMGRGTASTGPMRFAGPYWVNEAGSNVFKFEPTHAPTPEPATLLLMSGGVAACLRAARNRSRKGAAR